MCWWDDEDNASKKKSPTEDIEAELFYGLIRVHMPELLPLVFHVANESKSAPQYRSKLARMGVTPGVADYICITEKGLICIELKRKRKADSSVSKDQVKWGKAIELTGGVYCVCYGGRVAFEALKHYLSK